MKKTFKPVIVILFFLGGITDLVSQTITDIDGNVYDTITIGNQIWMQQNLKVAHFNDGSAIMEIQDSLAWANIHTQQDSNSTPPFTPAWCYYKGDVANNNIYGKLYNYFVISDPRGVCPAGWRAASTDDYYEMINLLGGVSVAGAKMMSSDVWVPAYPGADNSSRFSAVPGSNRSMFGRFENPGFIAFYWQLDPLGHWGFTKPYFYLNSINGSISSATNVPSIGMSVRCIKGFSTEIKEEKNENSYSILFPNPTTESVTISVDESLIGSALTITDVTGRVITNVSVLNSAFSIPTSAFASGVYFVTVANEKGKMTKKLVKQ